MSKEHIFAEWLQKHLPKTGILNHEVYSELTTLTGVETAVTKHSGEPHSGRIRCVCVPCNTGWMSRLQEITKPILLPLIAGNRVQLNHREQENLAGWIAMLTMVSEYRDRSRNRVAISQEDRRWLKEHGTPPPKGWKIWLGNFSNQGEWRSIWVHSVAPIAGKEHIPERTDFGLDLPNTQSTTVVIGQLYVHVLSSALKSWVVRQDMAGRGRAVMPRLWPLLANGRRLRWPPTVGLSSAEAVALASSLYRSVKKVPPATGLR